MTVKVKLFGKYRDSKCSALDGRFLLSYICRPTIIEKLNNKFFIILILSFFAFAASAQKGEDTMTSADSALVEMQELLLESDLMRIRDSIRVAVLNEELSKLKNPQKQEQQALLAELQMIKNKDSIRLFQQKQSIEALREKTKGITVNLFYDTLFTIYAPLGSFTAAQRARDAQEKVLALYEHDAFDKDSLVVVAQYGLLNINYGHRTITSLSNTDALWVDKDLDSMAIAYKNTIATKVIHFQKMYSFRNVMIRIGYSALVIAGLMVVLWLINFVFRRGTHYLEVKKLRLLKGIKVKNYELFSPSYMLSFFRQVLYVLKIIVMLVAVYMALTIIFSIFPTTRAWTHTLLQWIWKPLKNIGWSIIDYLPNLFAIAVILFVTRLVVRIFRFFSLEIERGILNIKGFHKEWAKPTYNIIRFLIYAFAFVIIFPYLPGSDSVAFKGVSVFLGILFSIGSSSAIANTVAGFVITYMRPFKIGDWIQVKDITGCVLEKTALVTRLRTIHNEDITVPNSTILANHTTNFSSSSNTTGLLINTTVTIGYDIDWHRVHELLLQSALNVADIDTTRPPFVFQKELNDYYVSYEINVYTRHPERMYHIKSDLHQYIQDYFKAAGIEIVSPQQIHIKP